MIVDHKLKRRNSYGLLDAERKQESQGVLRERYEVGFREAVNYLRQLPCGHATEFCRPTQEVNENEEPCILELGGHTANIVTSERLTPAKCSLRCDWMSESHTISTTNVVTKLSVKRKQIFIEEQDEDANIDSFVHYDVQSKQGNEGGEAEIEEPEAGEVEARGIETQTRHRHGRRRPSIGFDEIGAEVDYYSEHSSEEDSDFHPQEYEDEDGSDNEEGEDARDETARDEVARDQNECLPEMSEFAKSSFDCTEESPESVNVLDWHNELELAVGKEWDTIYECRAWLRMYAIKNKFEIWFQKNCTDKIIAKCKDKKCEWRCYIARLNDDHTMVCRGLKSEHTCVNDGQNSNCLANAIWIAAMIEDDMRRHHQSFTPRDIMKMVWHKYTVNIKYWKAWHARGIALERVHGNYELSYHQVPELCRQIERTNPGSLAVWESCQQTKKFKSLCVAFKASLEGWLRGCRPVVGFDGCHLRGKYSGMCLSAIGLDANNGMFPLAIFICKKEDGNSWDRFLFMLAPLLQRHHLPLTVMSDRAKGLKNAIATHFPSCNQRFCFRHMFKNLNKYWKGNHIKKLCWSASSAYRVNEFNRCLDKLEDETHGAKGYLMQEDPKMWSRSHFDCVSKCDHVTNNFTEIFNNFIMSMRDKPVCAMVTGISFLLMKIMYDRKVESLKWEENGLVPRVHKIIKEYKKKVNDYLTEPSGASTYVVRHFSGQYWTIELDEHTCTCGEWQVTGIPCVHGVYLITQQRLSFTQYCTAFCLVQAYRAAYQENIKPIPHENEWDEYSDVVLPPTSTRGAGRPKVTRYKGADKLEASQGSTSSRTQKKCGKCGGFGHNARSCQGGPIAFRGRGNSGDRSGRGGRGSKSGGCDRRGGGRGAGILVADVVPRREDNAPTLVVPPRRLVDGPSERGARRAKKRTFIPPSAHFLT